MASRYFTKTIAAAGTTMVIDLTKGWQQVYLQVGSMASTANLDLYAGIDGTTFTQVRSIAANTATAQFNSFVVAATSTANGVIVAIPPGFQYYKLVADSAPAGAIAFNVICSDGN